MCFVSCNDVLEATLILMFPEQHHAAVNLVLCFVFFVFFIIIYHFFML